MGKQNTQKKIRDSSLKHPLSKEFVCFMCFPFFSFFFPMFFVFLPNYFLVFPMFFLFVQGFFGLSLFLCFPACCTVRSTGFAGAIFSKQEASPKEKTILHFFKETCIKACPHCPQGIQGSLKEQLLI